MPYIQEKTGDHVFDLLTEIADSIFDMSEEEFLAEMKEEGVDVDAEARAFQESVARIMREVEEEEAEASHEKSTVPTISTREQVEKYVELKIFDVMGKEIVKGRRPWRQPLSPANINFPNLSESDRERILQSMILLETK